VIINLLVHSVFRLPYGYYQCRAVSTHTWWAKTIKFHI